MSNWLENFKKFATIYKTTFAQKSIFYRLSLDRRHNIFDTNKFITDPWSGNSSFGKDILNCNFELDNSEIPVNLMEILSGKSNKYVPFAAGFSWIRDIQSVGGNSARKYTRNLISTFINNYRKTKNFWINSKSWEHSIIGERIVNWIFSYSFFASGSNDKFQKNVLSSISEQFSHLLKSYKSEFNPYSRLMAIKAIMFCLCSMKINQSRQIKKIIKEITSIVNENFDDSGMFINRNPLDHFNMFRSLLEIRFIAKNSGMELPSEIFNEKLSLIASCVRFLRLGDGKISNHLGNNEFNEKKIANPSQQIIDTALSIVEIKQHQNKIQGFDRLSTKKSTVIINTEPTDVRSKFNHTLEPGINIFDFEASFATERLINRSDIAIIANGYRIKLDKDSKSFSKKTALANNFIFEGETHFENRFFKASMKRELSITSDKLEMSGNDFVYMSTPFNTSFRFVFNKMCEIVEINPKNIVILLDKSEYTFSIKSCSLKYEKIIESQRSEIHYPSAEIICESKIPQNININWGIEKTN